MLVGQVLLVRAEQVAEAPQLLTKMEQELQEQLILAAAAVVVVLYQVLLPVMVMVVLVADLVVAVAAVSKVSLVVLDLM